MQGRQERLPGSRKRISLTVRISALLIAAVILPLMITIISSEVILRPTLTSQALAEMANDAISHEQAINSLLIAREQDLEAVGAYYAIQQVLSGNTIYTDQARNELQLGYSLYSNYTDWTLLDAQGNFLLSYPKTPTTPSERAGHYIPPAILSQMQKPYKTVISDVYFNRNLSTAYIDIYTSLVNPANGKVDGIARSTLTLNEIWTAVNNETNAATGSYAVVIDGNGVRIAYTNTDTTLTTLPALLFKAIKPLSPQFQHTIQEEGLYGNGAVNTSTYFDATLAQKIDTRQQTSYQFNPVEQTQAYEAYQIPVQVVPWTYIVLRPVSTITGAASQQDIYLLIIAVVVTLLAGIVGLLVGRSTTRPLLQSVASLTKNSETLKVFSAREEARAKEQKWIVESAQTGLQSVQYYAKASSTAAQRLGEVVQDLMQNWERFDLERRQHYLLEIFRAADYIIKANAHEERSSRGLSTAIQVTSQITEQVLSGAAAASDAASQLEEVIAQLRRVVGE
jgi:hypothetical protein